MRLSPATCFAFSAWLCTIRWWRDDFGSKPPFDIGPDALIVAYSAWAEMTCFLALGWPFPQYVLDLHTAYLATSNTLAPWDSEEQQKHKKPRKRLSDACRAHGIRGWESVDKDVIAKDIGEGNWRKWGREAVIAYCEEDVAKTVELLRAQLLGAPDLEPIDVPHVIHWSEYSAKAIARIQARGMPIDTYRWNLVQENKAAVIAALLRRFDPSHNTPFPIYTIDGQWSYERFEQWLIYIGAPAWPRLESGRLDIGSDAFRLMFGVIPGIEGCTPCAIRSALSPRLVCRSGEMEETVQVYSPSRLRPEETPTAEAPTMPTPACDPSCCFRRTRSAFTVIGAARKSASPLLVSMIVRCRRII
jgi:hypothetical protein